jgi:hypothetical protein
MFAQAEHLQATEDVLEAVQLDHSTSATGVTQHAQPKHQIKQIIHV